MENIFVLMTFNTNIAIYQKYAGVASAHIDNSSFLKAERPRKQYPGRHEIIGSHVRGGTSTLIRFVTATKRLLVII